MKILIIDDDRKFCSALKDYLELKEHNVITYNLPEDGIKAVEKNKSFDVVFIDFKFENDRYRTGAEIGLKIRDISPLSALILVTAYGEDHIRDYIYVGFDNYIPKYDEGNGSNLKKMHQELNECIEKAINNTKKRIKTVFTDEELEPVRERMNYVKRAVEELKLQITNQQTIAAKIKEYMELDKSSGLITSTTKIPSTYNAHSLFFQLKIECNDVNEDGTQIDKTIYLEKALKARQILSENFTEWKTTVMSFEPLKKIKDEFDIS